MGITHREKMLLHIYANAAMLSMANYRSILHEYAGVASATDRGMNQRGFERAMAALETRLWTRVHAGDAPDPSIAGNRYIRKEYYWRHKCPAPGKINSRHIWKINELWDQFCSMTTPDQATTRYFAALAAKATGRHDVGISLLDARDAYAIIEALKDRITFIMRKEHIAESEVSE